MIFRSGISRFFIFSLFFFSLICNYLSAQNAANTVPDWKEKNSILAAELSDSHRGISSSIIDSLKKVPRHVFLDSSYGGIAYENISLPGFDGGSIPSPSDILTSVEYISPTSTDTVLVAGNNAGYAAAVLSRLTAKVYLIEETAAADKYRGIFAEYGFNNITISDTRDINSFEEIFGFDRIFIHGAVSEISERVTERLSIKGSITFILAKTGSFQQIVTIRRSLLGDSISCGGSCFFPDILKLKISN